MNDKRIEKLKQAYEKPRMSKEQVEDMKKMTINQLYSYYRDLVVSSKINIYVCGDAELPEVEEEIEEAKEQTEENA